MLLPRLPVWLILFVALVCSPGWLAGAVEPVPTSGKWEKEIAAFEQQDRDNPPPKGGVVFVGSSSIRMWKTLQQDFPNHRVLNRGFGGSELKDSVQFADRIVIPYDPAMVIVYAGGNDIHNGKSAEDVFGAYKAFVEKVHARLPQTEIAYISIAGNPARWAEVEKVKAANDLISTYINGQPHLKFINVFPRMLGGDGLPRPEIFLPDKLHMNAEGYKLWTEIVKTYLPASVVRPQ